MIWFLNFIMLLYALLIVSLAIGFLAVKVFKSSVVIAKNKFSIVIPFRNEAEHLPQLLASLLKINYPTNFFEIILVDDDSSDDSVAIINKILDTISQKNEVTRTDIRIIKNQRISNSPKKDAISKAIHQAKFDWIVTTDADCLIPENWLKTFNDFIQQKNPKMIVAPVAYKAESNFLDQFQLLDFYSLQASTVGGFGIHKPFLCNGANLCYLKSAFLEVNGFVGNDEIASGDDIFLFEKMIQKDKYSVQFLKSNEATVTTFPVKSWSALINQRVRWASKSSHYKSKFAQLVGLLIILANLGLLIETTLVIVNQTRVISIIVLWVFKILVDYILINKSFQFFEQKKSIFWFVISSFLYPFFIVFITITSLLTNYKWKDRRFKK